MESYTANYSVTHTANHTASKLPRSYTASYTANYQASHRLTQISHEPEAITSYTLTDIVTKCKLAQLRD